MGLEELLELQRLVQQAQQQGLDVEDLLERSTAPVNSTQELQDAIQRAEQAQEDVSEAGVVQQGLASISQGISGGFSADLFRMLEKLPSTPDDLDEQHIALLERAREEHPILSGIGQVGGAIGGMPGRVGGALARGARGLTRGGQAAGQGIAGLLGAGPGMTKTAGIAGGTAAGLLGGAAGGAAEGALMSTGEARTQNAPPPLLAAAQQGVERGAPLGAVVGGGVGAVGGLIGSMARARRGTRQRAESLQRELSEQSELPSGREVRTRIDDVGQQKRRAFAEALSGDVELPSDVTTTIMKDPVLRRTVERTGSEEAKTFMRRFQRWEQRQGIGGGVLRGEPMPTMSAQLADDIRTQAKRTADTFKRADLGSDPQIGTGAVRDAQEALNRLDPLLDEVPGFRAAQDLARLQGTQNRAWELAGKMRGKPVDEVEDALRGLGGAEAREAFRVRMARDLHQQLRGDNASVKSFINKASQSPEMRDKLRLIIGSEDRLDEFLGVVSRAAREQEIEDVIGTLFQMAGFLGGGTSLAGGVAIGLLGGG